ncbi:MAG TPA: DUF885 family protein, partial [Terriglobales bacterium]|nr:DUF885 family protein [Terriglobales bacterium]
MLRSSKPTLTKSLATVIFLFVMTFNTFAQNASIANNVEVRRKQLNDLLAQQWEYVLRTSPEFASILGDRRYNNKVSDVSEKAVLADLEETKKFLAKFEAVDATGFPEQEALNKTLMVRNLKEQIDNAKFNNWQMPVNQFFGAHIDLPQYAALFPFETVKDYDDYITRLKLMPRQIDDTIVNMRKGMKAGLMQPRFLLEKVVVQAKAIAEKKPAESAFAEPLAKLPKTFSAKDQARIKKQTHAAIAGSITPAYNRFIKFVKEEYAPKGRNDVGLWSLPDGAARYAAAAKSLTTTDVPPAKIHEIGLEQVAELERQKLEIAKKMGFNDLKSFDAAIKADPKQHPSSRQEILNLYRKYTDEMWKELPKLFGRLPKAKLEIRAVEAFREKEASGASYNQGTPDGSRPGIVKVNTYDFANKQKITIESTSYHEGVPGHHMQISIAQELPTLPPFRQQAGYTAYIEGWALYSERLGKEIGFYQDPYSDYGRLEDEMWRAIRLVVDTGVHLKKWNRQQVVDYMHEHSSSDEANIQSETDRYIAWPGQALAYKMGQLKIMELRAKAQKALGAKFDIRGFHDEVLG